MLICFMALLQLHIIRLFDLIGEIEENSQSLLNHNSANNKIIPTEFWNGNENL